MIRTPEQESICAAFSSGANVMVQALAGVGKSTTMVEVVKDLPRTKSVGLIVFNKKAKEDLEKKLQAEGLPHAKVFTANGLGHKALFQAGVRPTLDNDKIFKLTKEVGLRKDDLVDCMALVRSARMAGIVPSGLAGKGILPDTLETWGDIARDEFIDPILISPARDILRKSTLLALKGTIDFDDQIFITACIFGSFPRFDVTLVDEAQDLAPLNHIQVHKTSQGGQLGAVGDNHQAIYAFRGADMHSMANLRRLRSSWSDQTLSITYRCPRAVVERFRDFVPLFQAGPNNLEGTIESLRGWTPSPGSAVLCRNNAPLVKLAFALLRRRIPVQLLGRDIGKEMKRLWNKLSNHGKRSVESTIYEAARLAEAEPKKADKYDSLIAVLENTSSVEEMEAFLKESKNAVILATGHKAKGLEWDTVHHLEPQLIPSQYASTEEELVQEDNLRYVIETRTRDKLFLVRQENLQ